MSPTIERSVNNALPQSNELLGKPFLCLFALPRQSNCGQGPRVPFALLQVNELPGKPFLCLFALPRQANCGEGPRAPFALVAGQRNAGQAVPLLALPRQSNCGQGPRVPFALLQVNEMLGKPLFDCSKALQRWKEGPPDSSCD